MRFTLDVLLGGLLAAVMAGTAGAQPPQPPKPPKPPLPSAAPASAAEPMTAASRQVPTRNAAITASENSKEPGNQRPEERVIPQITVPLKGRNSPPLADAAASMPPGVVPGAVNDGAARCMSLSKAGEKAACERALATSGPVKR